MYIYEKIDYSLFMSRFKDYNREDQFSYAGLRVLYEYLTELAENTGEAFELDVIALCCEFAEINIEDIERETGAENIQELIDNYQVY